MNIRVIKERDGEKLTIEIDGRLTASEVAELERQMGSLEKVRELCFELENLDYIASAGIRAMLSASKKQRAKNASVQFLHAKPAVRKVFASIGLDEILGI